LRDTRQSSSLCCSLGQSESSNYDGQEWQEGIVTVSADLKTMPSLKCEHHAQASREYLVCVHVMNGTPISLFEDATERTPSKDGEDGWMLCSECAELDEEPLMAQTTLICGNCTDSLIADQDFVR
jgi:hypothetical protein